MDNADTQPLNLPEPVDGPEQAKGGKNFIANPDVPPPEFLENVLMQLEAFPPQPFEPSLQHKAAFKQRLQDAKEAKHHEGKWCLVEDRRLTSLVPLSGASSAARLPFSTQGLPSSRPHLGSNHA